MVIAWVMVNDLVMRWCSRAIDSWAIDCGNRPVSIRFVVIVSVVSRMVVRPCFVNVVGLFVTGYLLDLSDADIYYCLRLSVVVCKNLDPVRCFEILVIVSVLALLLLVVMFE